MAPLVGSFLQASSPIGPAAAQQAYHVASLHAVADVRTDGSIRMTEELAFQFDLGTFKFAYRDLPWRGFDALQDVQVLDGSRQPLPTTVTFESRVSGQWHIRWTYPSAAAPALRRFVVEYTLTNALAQSTSDRNRVDWMAVGTGWGVWIVNASATVHLPAAAGNPTQFSYSPEPTSVDVEANGTELNYTIGQLEPGTGYRVIVDVPKFVDVRPDLLRIPRESPISAAILTFLIILAVMIALWWWKGREPRARNVLAPGILSAPPSALRPGEVEFLLEQSLSGGGMFGELLWLAKRGFLVFHRMPEKVEAKGDLSPLEVTEKGRTAWLPGNREGSELNEPERVLLQALSRSQMRRMAVLQTQYAAFERAMETRILALGYLEERPSKVRTWYGLAAVAVGILGFTTVILGQLDPVLYSVQGVSAGLTFSALTVGVMGYFIPRLTQKGAEERARWRQFLQGLRWRVDSVRRTDPGTAVSLFDEYVEFLPVVPGLNLPKWLTDLGRDLGGVPYEPAWFVPLMYPTLLSSAGGQGAPIAGIGSVPAHVALDFSHFAHAFAATFGYFGGTESPSGGGSVGGGGGGGVGGGGGGAG